jgi:hypothetical protein
MDVQIIGEPACTEHLRDGRMRFWRDFRAAVDFDGGKALIVMRAGTTTDGSSIPVLFRSLLPKDRTRQAGFIHDRLYADPTVEIQRAAEWDDACLERSTVTLTRRQCDVIWGRVANSGDRRASLPRICCWLGVLALRAFGWHAWRTHRSQDGEPSQPRLSPL